MTLPLVEVLTVSFDNESIIAVCTPSNAGLSRGYDQDSWLQVL